MASGSKLVNNFMPKRMKPTVVYHYQQQDDDQDNGEDEHSPSVQVQATSSSSPSPSESESGVMMISGLPDHISQLILSKLPPRLLFSVCSSWRRFIYSPLYPPFPSIYALLSPISTPPPAGSSIIEVMNFDPISSTWSALPPPPSVPLGRSLLHHPWFISRSLPIQSLSVSGRLVLIAATTADDNTYPLPLPLPLVFSPLSRTWSYGPPLSAPRRWCVAGTVSGSVFAASGVGSQFSSEVARSFEKWNLSSSSETDQSDDPAAAASNGWEKLGQLKNARFSRQAIDAVGCRGKLWMVDVKGDTVKERAVYDVAGDRWSEMPQAMVQGWRGPAASMKMMDGEEMYVVDQGTGLLQRYDFDRAEWVPEFQSPALRGAEDVAAGAGKVCVLTAGGNGIVIVDLITSPRRMWMVELPPGYHAVAVHLLPRPVSGVPDPHGAGSS